jgi:outer membrane protein OmpA-like peptidoglycan-associated protein
MYSFRYETNPGATPVSALQIVRNFHNAVRGAGGQVLRDTGGGDNRQTTLRLTRGASEIWVDINGYIRDYYMTIVEKQAMQQDVTVDAKAMADGLTATCHVEVPGIFFDTGKAVVKPESDAALKEIPKLL